MNTIKIGSQEWATKDLKVTKFRNGEDIPKEKTDDFELGMAEFPGDFRSPEERLADREAGRRPKSYEDWINGKTAISHVELAAMQERDRERRNG